MACGSALASRCPSCQAELPPGAAFCPGCGTPVTAAAEAPAPASPLPSTDDGLRRFIPAELLAKLEFAARHGGMAGERRTVTMLFCDLQGSTAAAEQMDPEDWAEVMNGAFEHLIAPVYRYEGTLARLMGDAILAFFGAPISHEDDPERAVLAGLEIADAIEPYKAEVRAQWGVDIDVRTGINTGLVVVGSVGSDLRVEYSAMGDAVNTAARMEQTAAPGTVQVSQATKVLVDKLFEFEDLGGVEVKGKTDPVPAFRVVRALPRPENLRGIEGLSSPLIGRGTELERLGSVIASARDGRGGIVSITGEAGLGKSRLAAEFRDAVAGAEVDHALPWYQGRSLSYETDTPYLPVRRLLRDVCDLDRDASPGEAWRRIEEAVASVLPNRETELTPFLAWLLDIPIPDEQQHRLDYLSPAELRGYAFAAAINLLEARSSREPVVVVFEDLHWADPASLDFVSDLLGVATRTGLVVLLLFRPRRQEGSWRIHEEAGRDHAHVYTEIHLGPLPEADARDLVANLLAIDGLPDAVREQLLDKSEGNPFFVEEIIRSMIDGGHIEHDGERWVATASMATISIPTSISAVLTTRLDALDEQTRHVAQAAAVVGRQFRYDELAACLPDIRGLDESLLELQRRELLREVARLPKRMYRFRHALVQEAAYQTVLLRQRTQLHAAVADFVERTQPERVEDLADHLVAARQPERALPYLVAAGERALAGYAMTTAIARFESALELMDETTPAPLLRRALEGLGKANEMTFDVTAALTAYERLVDAGEERNDDALRVSGLNKRGLVRGFFLDERSEGLADIAVAEDLAREHDNADGLVEACMHQCYLRTYHAEFDEVERYMTELAGVADDIGNTDAVLFGMAHLSTTLAMLTRFDEALERAEKALAKAEEVGNLHYQAELLTFPIAVCHFAAGDLEAVSAAVERGMEIAESIGDKAVETLAAYFQGRIAMEQGHYEDGLALLRRAKAAADSTGQPVWAAFGLCVVGTCYLQIGGPLVEQAYELHNQTLEVMELPTGSALGAQLWAEIGHCALAAGEVEEAKVLFHKAKTEQTMPMHWMRPSALIGDIGVALAEDRIDDARAIAGDLEAYVTDRGMRDWLPHMELAVARVAAAGGEHADALDHLAAAEAVCDELGLRRLVIEVRGQQARSLSALGRESEAADATAAGMEVAATIAASIRDPELRAAAQAGSRAELR